MNDAFKEGSSSISLNSTFVASGEDISAGWFSGCTFEFLEDPTKDNSAMTKMTMTTTPKILSFSFTGFPCDIVFGWEYGLFLNKFFPWFID